MSFGNARVTQTSHWSIPGGGWYLDGELPHSIFWVLLHILGADLEGPIGFLFCGPVVHTFLEGRELGVRVGGSISLTGLRQQRGLVSPPHISAHDPGP